METRFRSLAKAVCWRMVALVILATVSYIFTRSFKETGLITGVYTVIQIAVYWAHERVWQRVRWGRREHPLSHLSIEQPLTPEDEEKLCDFLRDLGYM